MKHRRRELNLAILGTIAGICFVACGLLLWWAIAFALGEVTP